MFGWFWIVLAVTGLVVIAAFWAAEAAAPAGDRRAGSPVPDAAGTSID